MESIRRLLTLVLGGQPHDSLGFFGLDVGDLDDICALRVTLAGNRREMDNAGVGNLPLVAAIDGVDRLVSSFAQATLVVGSQVSVLAVLDGQQHIDVTDLLAAFSDLPSWILDQFEIEVRLTTRVAA
jgi:hypothetical protein